MDHSAAHLIAFSIDKKDIHTISRDDFDGKMDAKEHGEKHANSKKRNLQEAFYKRVWSIAKDYREVVIFGPTDAKAEFFNQIRANHANDSVKISIRSADKMSHDDMHHFVYKYFKPIMLP